MKLESKHLAPYLPYGLNMVCNSEIAELYGLKRIGVLLNSEGVVITNRGEWDLFHALPILRPLSDLTKEIEINGERFLPKEKLIEIREYNHDEDEWLEDAISGGHAWIMADTLNLTYRTIQKLFEWHFDVFGLIENNLAIDVNTLK